MKILTGISLTASSMPCFLRLCVTFWNGSMLPVSGSMATHSPSMIASPYLHAERSSWAISGKLDVRSSSLLEYRRTWSFPMWA